jgi:hypothetical protein
MARWKRLALLALPFVVVPVAVRLMVPRWGRSIAHVLSDVVGAPPLHAPPPAALDVPGATYRSDLELTGGPRAEVVDASAPVGGRGAQGTHGGVRGPVDAGGAADDGGTIALFVPASVVQRTLDDQGSHIRGRTARNVEGKPIGVRLTGIDAARVGLHDGDLIVAIDGTPTPDDDIATDAALSAVAKGRSRIQATLLRGARKIDLTVELPDMPAEPVPRR